jgi:hypothetical protein
MNLGAILEEAKNANPIAPDDRVSPELALTAITALRRVSGRLDNLDNGDALQRCITFAQEAVWAAAYPDGSSMLEAVADDARTAIG